MFRAHDKLERDCSTVGQRLNKLSDKCVKETTFTRKHITLLIRFYTIKVIYHKDKELIMLVFQTPKNATVFKTEDFRRISIKYFQFPKSNLPEWCEM